MPFDDTERERDDGEEELRVLLATRKRLRSKRHWLQGSMYHAGFHGIGERACLVGHLMFAAGVRPTKSTHASDAPDVVERIARKYNQCHPEFTTADVRDLLMFNDSHATTHKHVLRWLDAAIAEAQEGNHNA